ncbi:hypothetical protein SAMN05444349_106100 [Bacteroides faecichinchillae]|uniref:Kelch motif-containing protein n=4 Tax=Bacteroides faecichinchillae TaxID=871325 RepID=A0A1M4WGT2_9BACE|nr:hypothetical protein SAMN05444349_106100 [Bacteroides faecichinchillae]
MGTEITFMKKICMQSLRLLYTLFALWSLTLNCFSQGLSFYGNEKRISERSSFQVFTEDRLPDFSKELNVSFEYSVQNIGSPGYILLLKDENSGKAFNLNYLYRWDGSTRFIFAEDGKKAYYSVDYANGDLNHRWIPVSIHLYNARNRAKICIGNDSILLEDIGLKGEAFSPNICFGMYDYILETASFSIRNLSVANEKRKWTFPLNESHGENVHDSSGTILGKVKKPVWLINQSYYWNPVFTHYSSTPSGITFDKKQHQIFIYTADSLFSYDLDDKASRQIPFQNRISSRDLQLGMNFQDQETGEIYAYELTSEKVVTKFLPNDEPQWTPVYKDEVAEYICLHHHCGFYHPGQKEFLLFGGYGRRSYSGKFISYHVSSNRWDTIPFSGDKIMPRFYAGVGVSPDYKHLYIYGGKGNEAGDQNIGIEYFYDLYQVDWDKRSIRKLWEQEPPAVNRVVSRDMVVSKDEQSIYFLSYPEYQPQSHIQLYRMNIADGNCEALGDSIPLVSEEIATNVNLYYSEKLGCFYCTIQEFEETGGSSIRMYSLLDVPVTLAEVRYYDLLETEDVDWLDYGVIAIIVAAILLLCLFVWKNKRRVAQSGNTGIAIAKEENMIADVAEVHFKDRNAIFLFGAFVVLDRDGKDITYMFSPKLRAIFLYILLNSASETGVLSSDMNELFWPDKTDDKVKNLKGVTVNHIRKILQELDGIELIYEKGHFLLKIQENFYCDYLHFSFLRKDKKLLQLREEEMGRFLKILIRGRFLNGIDHELFDYYKHELEEFILTFIPPEIEKAYKVADFMKVVHLCNVLFFTDALNEQAMFYAVRAFQKMGYPKEALKRYNSFINLYKKAMNENYPVKYESIPSLDE